MGQAYITSEQYDFDKLNEFLKEWAFENGTSLRQLSASFFRGENYISSCLSSGKMLEPIFNAICEKTGIDPLVFEIVEVEDEYEDEECEYDSDLFSSDENDWNVKIHVDFESMDTEYKLFNGSNLVCTTYAHLKGTEDIDVAQSISYASHMAYKYVEQRNFRQRHGGKK